MRCFGFFRCSVRPLLWLAGMLVGAMSLLAGASTAQAADVFDGRTALVMVDDAGCVYCAKWDREVRTGYEASPEGHFAPLARIRIGSQELSGLGRLTYTPTFVLIVAGQEKGRIVGYGGADFFWAEIDKLYVKAGFRPDAEPKPTIENRAEIRIPLGSIAAE